MVYHEDNLITLDRIDNNFLHLIYSDILYGTGRDFGEYRDIKATKQDVEEFYLERLLKMCNKLSHEGNIVLQMDKRISHWIRLLLDDLLGYENFRNEITWCYSGGGVSSRKFSCKSDVILWYSKSKDYYFKPQFIPYTGSQKAHPYSKNREEKSERGKHLEDWWSDINSFGGSTNHPERRLYGYPTQKPEALMERVIDTWSKKGDNVGDFFMGSGTFLAVAEKKGRNIVGCDISKTAYEMTKKRINENYL